MNDREKLVELINAIQTAGLDYSNISAVCKTSNESLADHLLANGVTFAADNNVGGKWIPVTERLPEPFVSVLISRDGEISIDYHEENGWFAYDFNGKRATHWMPLPEPPKEGEG